MLRDELFFSKVKRLPNGCWEWQGNRKKNAGYGRVKRKGRSLQAHRYSYELRYGEFDKMLLVLHKCDNPPCVNPEHLFLGTSSDNTRDMITKGRYNCSYGADRYNAKLTMADIEEIKTLYKSGVYTQRAIGLKFGVLQNTISRVVNGVRWARAVAGSASKKK